MGNKFFKLRSKSKVTEKETQVEEVLEDPCTPLVSMKTTEEVNEETKALLESACKKLQSITATANEAEEELLRAMTMLKLD